jgi:hypothetical protein
MPAFVVRTEFDNAGSAGEVWQSLKNGEARIGWSYKDDLDLQEIVDVNERGAWGTLNPEQQDAWRCHGFVDRARPGDYLFYPNVPEDGQFAVVRLLPGDYRLLTGNQSINGDFRSTRPCELVTLQPLARSDRIVHPWLRRRLGLQGRFYELYDQEVLDAFLDHLKAGEYG